MDSHTNGQTGNLAGRHANGKTTAINRYFTKPVRINYTDQQKTSLLAKADCCLVNYLIENSKKNNTIELLIHVDLQQPN